jgi:hypothetical protein
MWTKGIGRKLGAFVLVFALVLPLVGTQKMTVQADDTKEFLFQLYGPEKTAWVQDVLQYAKLEVGDEISLYFGTTGSGSLSDVGEINFTLVYDENVFETVTDDTPNSNFTLEDSDNWHMSYEKASHLVTLEPWDDNGISVRTQRLLLKITLKVKSAVDGHTDIGFKDASYNQMKSNDTTQTNTGNPKKAQDKNYHVVNVMTGKRSFVLNIPTSSITINTNTSSARYSSENLEKEIAVQVTKDPNSTITGQDKKEYESCNVYNGFTLQFTYDSSLMTYEGASLSSTAGTRARLYEDVTCGTDADGKTIQRVSVVGAKDINLFDIDIVYLKFAAKQSTKSTDGAANITFEIYNGNTTTTSGTTTSSGSMGVSLNSTKYTDNTCNISTESYDSARVGFLNGTGISTSSAVVSVKLTNIEALLGDINNDSKIDLIDVTMALRYYNGDLTLDDEQITRGDINGSGNVTLIDAAKILKYYTQGKTSTSDWNTLN